MDAPAGHEPDVEPDVDPDVDDSDVTPVAGLVTAQSTGPFRSLRAWFDRDWDDVRIWKFALTSFSLA